MQKTWIFAFFHIRMNIPYEEFFFSVHCAGGWSDSSVMPILHINSELHTGCSLNFVFFPKILEYSGLCSFLFFLGVSVCTHTRQVEHQRCSRIGRVQKNHKMLRKNTIINEHPVCNSYAASTDFFAINPSVTTRIRTVSKVSSLSSHKWEIKLNYIKFNIIKTWYFFTRVSVFNCESDARRTWIFLSNFDLSIFVPFTHF